MQQDPIENEIKAEDNSFNDIWKNLNEMFLEGLERAENDKRHEVKNQDGG